MFDRPHEAHSRPSIMRRRYSLEKRDRLSASQMLRLLGTNWVAPDVRAGPWTSAMHVRRPRYPHPGRKMAWRPAGAPLRPSEKLAGLTMSIAAVVFSEGA